MPNRAAINCTFDTLCHFVIPPPHPQPGYSTHPRGGRIVSHTWWEERSLLLKLHVGQGLLVLKHAGVKHGSGPVSFLQGCPLGQGSHDAGGEALPSQKKGEGGISARKKKHKSGQKKRCVEERERMCWTEAKRKQKRVHSLENIVWTARQHPCVYKNNNNNNNNSLIISSLASKQQSDTSTTQAEHGALLELLAISIHVLTSLSGSFMCFNSVALGLTRCNMSKHYLLRLLTRGGTGRKYTEREAALLAPW